MKYIRTKDGIYTKCNLIGYEDYWVLSHNCNPTPLKELKIIKQVDSIRELCDCWIIILKYLNVKPYTENINCNIAHLINNEHQIYGAIWTYDSDGAPTLKAVAKMNNKGELELL